MKPGPEARADGAPGVILPVDVLRQLAARMAIMQAKARALGLFANDRELLECPGCGLMENVAVDGRLFTCRLEALEVDTRLCFEELSPHRFRCPACGAVVPDPPGD